MKRGRQETNIQPKLLRLAGDAIIPSLESLYRYSMETKTVFTSWKTAKITPVFKKDDETDRGNYRPISLLSVPSKILESLVSDALVRHSFKENAELVSDKQRAYRAGYSTELLLIRLTETWRRAVDSGLLVAVAFVDFKKAFDSVCHTVLETKLQRDFGIRGPLLDWLKSYLKGRQQVTIVNGVNSGTLPVSCGIPQGSVLGPTLFTMFMNDLPTSVVSGSLYMFADDTTIYCIGTSADEATTQLNLAMHELYSWCLTNKLTPHPGKNQAMLISRKSPTGPTTPILIGGHYQMGKQNTLIGDDS